MLNKYNKMKPDSQRITLLQLLSSTIHWLEKPSKHISHCHSYKTYFKSQKGLLSKNAYSCTHRIESSENSAELAPEQRRMFPVETSAQSMNKRNPNKIITINEDIQDTPISRPEIIHNTTDDEPINISSESKSELNNLVPLR